MGLGGTVANTIGLKAVMDMAGFTAGINEYNNQVNGASSNTENKSGIITKALGTIGSIAAGVAAAGVAALTTAIVGGIKATMDWAETVDSVGDVLGTTAEESSALAVAAEYIGGNVTQLTGQMAFLTRGLYDAQGQLGPTGQAMTDMGITFTDANGNLLPTTEILQNVADKVGTMDDGLQKTDAMMTLFGKSGKDMSDMLGVLANGGMEAMNQKAKDLGLSLGEEGSEGAIQFGRSMNELKLMGKGLLVTLGSELLPILKPLIDQFMVAAVQAIPYVKKAIEDAIPVIQAIFEWIGVNLIPVIQSLVAWMAENLPPAIEKAYNWFKQYILPVLQEVWAYIQQNVIPIFQEIIDTLSIYLPPVIKAAADMFTTVFLPVLNVIWDFISTTLLPIFEDIVVWLRDTLGTAVAAAVKWWSETYMPALASVATWVSETLIPTFLTISEWLTTTIGEAIDTFEEIWGRVMSGFEDVRDFIRDDLMPKLNTIFTFFNERIAGPINTFVYGALAGLNTAFGTLQDILGPIVDFLRWIIENIGNALTGGQTFAGLVSQRISDWWTGQGGGNDDTPPGQVPSEFSGGLKPRRLGFGAGSSGAMMMGNTNTISMVFNVALNNGMDVDDFRVLVLDTVSGALA